MGTKDLLLVSDGVDIPSRLTKSLASRHWAVHRADGLKSASALREAYPLAVGLMVFDVGHPPNVADVENTIVGSHNRWVALVTQAPDADTTTGQLLGQLFFAYHVVPVDIEQLDCLLNHALAMTHLEAGRGAKPINGETTEHPMVGATPVVHTLLKAIQKVAMVDAPVFISGETGTGKELTARAIHEQSSRARGPFNAVNCGALPASLIQSELFGHEKGAFTGASQRRIGRIEATVGGTLFLDEIGDLPLDMQVNLLRFLENHKIQRVGSLDEIPVDVRVLAATYIDLEKAVEEGRFREDLYHRLNVLQIDIPPLRERQEDIELLARFFFDKFSNEKPVTVRGFSQEALTLLRQYSWPGNVRELINRVRRAMVMCEHRLIRPADLGLERRHYSRHVMSLEQARDLAEKEVVKAALARNKDKIQHAAKDLGISRVTLYRLIEKHGIMRGDVTATTQRESENRRVVGS